MVRLFHVLGASLGLVLVASAAWAERAVEAKSDAERVIVGRIKQISTSRTRFGNDGTQTNYTVRVTVERVERGTGARRGEVVRCRYFCVTKRPSRAIAGAYGHRYGIRKGDRVRVYLTEGNQVIYSPSGIEKLR